jgi:hypothetical protein
MRPQRPREGLGIGAAISGLVITVGGLLITIGLAESAGSKTANLHGPAAFWRNGWFDAGILVVCMGLAIIPAAALAGSNWRNNRASQLLLVGIVVVLVGVGIPVWKLSPLSRHEARRTLNTTLGLSPTIGSSSSSSPTPSAPSPTSSPTTRAGGHSPLRSAPSAPAPAPTNPIVPPPLAISTITPTPPPGPPLDGGAHDTSFEHDDMGNPPFGRPKGDTLHSDLQYHAICNDGQAHDGSCYLEVSAPDTSPCCPSLEQEIPYALTPGRCFTLSGWFRSRSATTLTVGLYVYAVPLYTQPDVNHTGPYGPQSFANLDQSQGWKQLSVTLKVPSEPSGGFWGMLRGGVFPDAANQLLDWDQAQWYGPYAC